MQSSVQNITWKATNTLLPLAVEDQPYNDGKPYTLDQFVNDPANKLAVEHTSTEQTDFLVNEHYYLLYEHAKAYGLQAGAVSTSNINGKYSFCLIKPSVNDAGPRVESTFNVMMFDTGKLENVQHL